MFGKEAEARKLKLPTQRGGREAEQGAVRSHPTLALPSPPLAYRIYPSPLLGAWAHFYSYFYSYSYFSGAWPHLCSSSYSMLMRMRMVN